MRNRIIVLVLAALTLATLAGARRNISTDQTAAIKTVAQNYMNSYYTADVAGMQQTLHPEFHKRSLRTVNGHLEITEDSVQSMLEGVRAGTGKNVPQSDRIQKIEVLDVYKNVASVKVVTGRWIDYMHLSELNGEWRVLDVVLQYTQ
jgi:Putative lumazine-binding